MESPIAANSLVLGSLPARHARYRPHHIAVIVGGRDEYLDRPAQELVAAFEWHATRTRAFTGIIVPRARHGFRGHEPALAREVVRWARTVR